MGQLLELFSIHSLLLDKHLGQLVENGAIVGKNLSSSLVCNINQARDLTVDHCGGLLGEVAFSSDIATKEHASLRAPQSNRSDSIAHSKASDHLPGGVRDLLEIIRGTCGDLVFAVDDLFCDTTTQGDSHLVLEIGP